MDAIEVKGGSELLYVLAHITTKDEAGRHFAKLYADDVIGTLEDAGLIEIDRPVHQPTGIPTSQESWSVTLTEKGHQLVDELYDERDYQERE